MLTRPAFEQAVRRLSGQGFKILLDLFASTPTAYRFKEIPYVFGQRQHGESKLDSLVVWEYLMLLTDKLVGRYVPARFVSFAAIGGSGVVVHFTTLYLGLKLRLVPGGASARHLCCDDQQLCPEQHADLSRPASYRPALYHRAAFILCRMQSRRGRQCRHRLGSFCPALHLVGLGSRGCGCRGGVELRGVFRLYLAAPVTRSDVTRIVWSRQ